MGDPNTGAGPHHWLQCRHEAAGGVQHSDSFARFIVNVRFAVREDHDALAVNIA